MAVVLASVGVEIVVGQSLWGGLVTAVLHKREKNKCKRKGIVGTVPLNEFLSVSRIQKVIFCGGVGWQSVNTRVPLSGRGNFLLVFLWLALESKKLITWEWILM